MTFNKNSTLYSLWTRYKFIPLYWKVLSILFLLLGVFSLDQQWISSSIPSEILHRLYFLPIILSGLLFGFKGGLLSAIMVTLLFVPHWFEGFRNSRLHSGHLDEVILFFTFGGLIGLLVDRERMESQLRQDQEHLALIGEAAATVAHELKNPVITIGAYTQKILSKTAAEDPIREKLLVIQQESLRIENLLKDMIHFSRPINLDISMVDINLIIKETLRSIQPQMEQKQVPLSSNLDTKLPSIRVDKVRITQVLHNILLNAIQASPADQPIGVQTLQSKGRVLIQVSDRGGGIPQDCQKKIFSPFYTTKKEGSGLGLAVSKRIIELHQGRLFFRANQPSGTVFCISLPIHRKITPA